MKRIFILGFLSSCLFVTSFANAAVDAEVAYIFNSFLADKIVLVSKRSKKDLMFKLNSIFFYKKVNIIENGINTKKFKK